MKNIIIMGTGRSGTSLVAGLFRDSAATLGDDHLTSKAANKYGYNEDSIINNMNDLLLTRLLRWRLIKKLPSWMSPPIHRDWRGLWLAAPRRVRCRSVPPNILDPMVERFQTQPFCYKDPRFSVTLPLWRPYLPDGTRFIAVFRSPALTVDSMLRDATESYDPPLPLTRRWAYVCWYRTYHRLLDDFSKSGEWFFVQYDQVLSGAVIPALEHFSEGSLDTAQIDSRASRAVVDSGLSSAIGRKCMSLFHRLCERSERDAETWSNSKQP